MRVAHYVNQFFAGIGGEDAAGEGPQTRPGPVGPGMRLKAMLEPEHEIVVTLICGDDHAAAHPEALEGLVEQAVEAGAEAVVAGPAFTSGRYGLACSRVARAAAGRGLVALAAMHAENPGLDEAGAVPVVASGRTAREMRRSLEALGPALRRLLEGGELGPDDGRVSPVPRRNTMAQSSAATRAVALALTRLGGERDATEIPVPDFDAVTPAAPLEAPGEALIALVTEGGVVPAGNPDRVPSARSTGYRRYALDIGSEPGALECIHGGFSTQWANEDTNRVLPLDVARELEGEGAIGRLHAEWLVTTGNGTTVANARRLGIEWAAELRAARVQAAILTST